MALVTIRPHPGRSAVGWVVQRQLRRYLLRRGMVPSMSPIEFGGPGLLRHARLGSGADKMRSAQQRIIKNLGRKEVNVAPGEKLERLAPPLATPIAPSRARRQFT